jgi:hypothetical protein
MTKSGTEFDGQHIMDVVGVLKDFEEVMYENCHPRGA